MRTRVREQGARGLRRIGFTAGAALIIAAAGCAPSLQHEHVDTQMLTREQIAPTHFHSVLEAVQALRGNWLAPLNTTELGGPLGNNVAIYLDNVRLGDPSELQNIPLNAVAYIRYFDPLEATTRWGLEHPEGVIYVSTHPVGSAAAPPGN